MNLIISMVCQYCSKVLRKNTAYFPQKLPSICECGKQLPRCSICNLYLGHSDNPEYSNLDGIYSDGYSINESFWDNNRHLKSAFVWCRSCEHVSHVACALKWFKDPVGSSCAFASCGCQCSQLD